jgi:hypothetical protein
MKPLLFMDIDGVIVLWKATRTPCRMLVVGGQRCRIPIGIEDHLRQLSECFTPMWLTGWRQNALLLGAALGAPDWPSLPWPVDKIPAIRETVAGRPWAWVDDEPEFETDRYGYPADNGLIHKIDDAVGLRGVDVCRLIEYAASFSAS